MLGYYCLSSRELFWVVRLVGFEVGELVYRSFIDIVRNTSTAYGDNYIFLFCGTTVDYLYYIEDFRLAGHFLSYIV